MLPAFDKEGFLPVGEHEATWDEFTERFAWNERRQNLMQGLSQVIDILRQAECPRIWIDGSFVTSKELPGDFDACYDHADVTILEENEFYPPFWAFRRWQKEKFGGEIVPFDAVAEPLSDGTKIRYREFFQQRRNSNKKKGIVVIKL
jgi:hypothetical protein